MVDVRVPGLLVTAALGVAAATTYADLPAAQWVPDLVVALAAVGVAVLTWRTTAVSLLALAGAASWWAGTLAPEALYWHRGVLIHLALSAPRGWPRAGSTRAAIVLGYLVSSVPALWQNEPVAILSATGVVAVGVVESRSRRRRWGYAAAPVLLGAAIVAGVALPDLAGADDGPVTAVMTYGALVTASLAVVAVMVRSPSRAELTDLAVDLGPEEARDLDTLTSLVRAEPGLASDAELQEALASARRLEAANEEARAQVREAIVEVDRSRRRLVVAASLERGRLASELADTSAARLRDLVDRAAVAGIHAPALARASAGLDAALLGLRPPALAHGLATALVRHPLVASLEVTLDIAHERCDEVVEETLYSVVVESLTNAAKYAGPCRVAVKYAVAAGLAEMTVTDDGVGGAAAGHGTGLAGLKDRLEALGGGLRVSSPPGAGTVVRAWVPREVTGSAPRRPISASTPAAP